MADKGLTKEYFDKHLGRSLKDLRVGMTKDLKEHVTSEIEKLAIMTARGFEDMQKRLDVREDVEKLKRDNQIIKQALNL